MTTTGDEPLDPQELIEAAEAAHLAARRTVPIPRAQARPDAGQDERSPDQNQTDPELDPDGARPGESEADRETVWLVREAPRPEHETVRLDGATVRLDQEQLRRAGPAEAGTPPTPPTAAGAEPAPEPRRGAPLPVAAAVAASWAALATFLPVAVVVGLLLAAELGDLTPAAAAQVTAAGWLLAHGVPVQTGAGTLGLAPLALSAVAAWRLARAGVHVTRARGGKNSGSVAQVLVVAAAVGIGYGLIGAIMAAVTSVSGWGTPVLRSAGTLAILGFLFAGYGAMRATGVLTLLRRRTPKVLREAVRTGTVAAAGVLAAGAATAGTALAVSGGPAAEVLAAYGTGVAGQAGLTLLCLAYAPTMAIWAAAYLVGPGFAFGVDTIVRNSEVVLGPLPAVPVFAALPSGPLPGLGAALLVAPVLAGGVGGWLLARRTRPRDGAGPGDWAGLAVGALFTGVVAGLLMAAAAVAATGSLGDGQLATIGPNPLLVGVSTAATVTVGALLGAAIGVGPTRTQPR